MAQFWYSGRGLVLSCTLGLLTLTGCGSNGGAKVTGKVTFQGQPVTGGTLVFAPVAQGEKNPGAPGTATISKDGSFTAATRVREGKCTVSYNAPMAEFPPGYTPRPSEPAPQSPFTNLMVKDKEIELKGGTPVNIELVPRGGRW